jgi:hypothetical protein
MCSGINRKVEASPPNNPDITAGQHPGQRHRASVFQRQAAGRNKPAGQGTGWSSSACGELDDHYRCIIEQESQPEDASAGAVKQTESRRPGSSEEIVSAIIRNPKLAPLAWRHPLAIFIVMRSDVLCCWNRLAIQLASKPGMAESDVLQQPVMIEVFQISVLLVPGISRHGDGRRSTAAAPASWSRLRGHAWWRSTR